MRIKIDHQRIWFTSDYHFFHSNVIKFDERPSFDEDGSISDAAKERYDINEKRRDPEAAKIRKEYRKRIEDVKKEIQKQREKDDDEIKKMKSQKNY